MMEKLFIIQQDVEILPVNKPQRNIYASLLPCEVRGYPLIESLRNCGGNFIFYNAL